MQSADQSHPLTLCLNRKELPDIVWSIRVPSKRYELTQSCFNVGPPSSKPVQH